MSETAKFLTPEQAARVDHSRFDAEKIDRPTITYWKGAWRRLKKNHQRPGVHQDQRVHQEYGSEQCQLVWHRHHGP